MYIYDKINSKMQPINNINVKKNNKFGDKRHKSQDNLKAMNQLKSQKKNEKQEDQSGQQTELYIQENNLKQQQNKIIQNKGRTQILKIASISKNRQQNHIKICEASSPIIGDNLRAVEQQLSKVQNKPSSQRQQELKSLPQPKALIKQQNKNRIRTFKVTTEFHQEERHYIFKGTFSLFNNRSIAQTLFIEKAFSVHPINLQSYHILLGIESYVYNDQGVQRQLQSYQDVVLNSFSIPESLQPQVKNCQDLYLFLNENQKFIELGVSSKNKKAVTFLKLGPASKFGEQIYIPLYYSKDIIKGKGVKKIGFVRFKSDIPKKIFAQIVQSEYLRKVFYGKAFRIQPYKSDPNLLSRANGNNCSLFKLMQYVQKLSVKVLLLSKGSHECLNTTFKFTSLKILCIYELESLQFLQLIEFSSLEAIVVGNRSNLNLRSLRKLYINPKIQAQKDLKSDCYPGVIQVRSGGSITFTNLSYLIELPFARNFSGNSRQSKVKYMGLNDVFMPAFLFAKMNASISNQNQNHLFQLHTIYKIAALCGSILGRELKHLGNQVL